MRGRGSLWALLLWLGHQSSPCGVECGSIMRHGSVDGKAGGAGSSVLGSLILASLGWHRRAALAWFDTEELPSNMVQVSLEKEQLQRHLGG